MRRGSPPARGEDEGKKEEHKGKNGEREQNGISGDKKKQEKMMISVEEEGNMW